MRIMTRNVTRTLIRSDAVMALALVIPGDNFRRLDKFRPRNLLLLLLLLLLLCSAHAGNPAPTLAPTGTLRAVYIATNPVQAFVDPKTDRKSTRLNSSHGYISYAVFCLKKK